MHIFYTPDIEADFYQLSESESKHCIRVLRLQLGDTIYLVDGRGSLYTSVIVHDHPKHCKVEIKHKEEEYRKRNYHIHIAMAPTKNIERFEWFLEKATEIGIDEITPLLCDNSERKIIKPERLNKVIEAAMKQSMSAYHPRLNDIEIFRSFVKKERSALSLIAHCYESEKSLLKKSGINQSNVLICIGPEGDFSTDEVLKAKANGFTEISLGDARLRTETAGIFACSTVALINQ